jgi:hypothetical protein
MSGEHRFPASPPARSRAELRNRFTAQQLTMLAEWIGARTVTTQETAAETGWDRERSRVALAIVARSDVTGQRVTKRYRLTRDWERRVREFCATHPAPREFKRAEPTGVDGAELYPTGDPSHFDVDRFGGITYHHDIPGADRMPMTITPTGGRADGFLLSLRTLVQHKASVTTLPAAQRARIADLLLLLEPMAEGTPRASHALRALTAAWDADRLALASVANVDTVRTFVATLGVR